MTKKCLLLLCMVATALNASAVSDTVICKVEHIVPERLPDMNVPRSGHNIFYAGGELTVTGGHTTNFATTSSAEYYADGQWHSMTMAYAHDNGFAVVLRSGEVIIGGGHDEPLGIGQTFFLERYHSSTHTFEGFGCLDRRRVLTGATQLADGRIVISGNHYADDDIAYFDGQQQVKHMKTVRQGRSNPYILRMTDGDALILGANDVYDHHPDTVWADRLRGDAIRVPLLEQWRLVYTDQPFNSDACATGMGTYLLTVTDRNGQLAFVEVRDTSFTLLPTACPVPMRSYYGPINYKGIVVTDSLRQRGYVLGVDSLYLRQYVLAINYGMRPAQLTLYYTAPIEHAAITIPIVTPEGNLLVVGGIPGDNFKPLANVWLYHFATEPPSLASSWPLWMWALLGLAIAATIVSIIYIFSNRSRSAAPVTPIVLAPKNLELMERINQLMEQEQFYLHSNLKLQDVAVRLQTNSTYVSECINSVCGQTFSQFVNTYRVRYAQELLRRQPEMKTSVVATESGFNTEASFFRNFKAVTGMTPREWITDLMPRTNTTAPKVDAKESDF